LADGRLLAAIQVGDEVDGARVLSATLEPYDGGSTIDLLPDSPTGACFSEGIPLSSTPHGELNAISKEEGRDHLAGDSSPPHLSVEATD